MPKPRADVVLGYEASRARYHNKSEFFIASLELCGNTGTYVDAPIHRYRGGADLAELPLERLAHVPVALIDAGARNRAIGPSALDGHDLRGKAVLFRTGFSRYWRTPEYFELNPFLTRETCELLVQRGAWFAGIDSLNIDDVGNPERPAHTILLANGIPICEHMTNLAAAPPAGGFLHAVPIAWRGGASFPVRAYILASSG
jgi:kynurenine formamidase